MRSSQRREHPVVAVRVVRVFRRGPRSGLLGRLVGAGYRGAVEAGAGIEVGDVADYQTAGDRITRAVLHRYVVDFPPEAERGDEVEPYLHRAMAASLGDRDRLEIRAKHAFTAVVPDVAPGGSAVGAQVDVTGLTGEAEVVVVELEHRGGHAGEIDHRANQRGILVIARTVEV